MSKIEFGYSFSRFGTAKSCLRKYFYSYYFQRNSYTFKERDNYLGILKNLTYDEIENTDDVELRKYLANVFKKSTGYYMFVGSVVHEQIDILIKKLQKGKYLERALWVKYVNRICSDLKKKLSESWDYQKSNEFILNPGKGLLFYEFVNSNQFTLSGMRTNMKHWEEFSQDIVLHVSKCLNYFFISGLYDKLKEICDTSSIVESEFEEKVSYPFNYKGSTVQIPFYLRPDFFFIKSDVLNIIDWKTGSMKNVDFFELEIYGYLLNKVRNDFKQTNLKVYSFKNNEFKSSIQPSSDYIESKLNSHLTFLSELTEDGLENNIIKDDNENNFSKNIDKGLFGCKACSFLHICKGTKKNLNLLT